MRLTLRPLAPLVALAAACSTTPLLELTVTPTSVAGDGQSPVTVEVKLTASAGRIKDSTADPNAYDIAVSGGAAIVTILPPRKGRGTIDVKATASLDGTALSKAASVALTPSGGLASSLTFTCAKQNIGALVSGRAETIHVLCTAVAYDSLNRPIPKASIETLAEAGTLAWITAETT